MKRVVIGALVFLGFTEVSLGGSRVVDVSNKIELQQFYNSRITDAKSIFTKIEENSDDCGANEKISELALAQRLVLNHVKTFNYTNNIASDLAVSAEGHLAGIASASEIAVKKYNNKCSAHGVEK